MVDPFEIADVATAIGTFRVGFSGEYVRVVDLLESGVAQTGIPPGAVRRAPPFARESPPRQLAEYFKRERDRFTVRPDPQTSSEFDRKVWERLTEVPIGRTVSYGELARQVGHLGSARAVGGSMARNPIPIIVPCHRVVGADGSVTGYGLGLWRKRWLLEREGAWPLRSRSAEGPRPHQRTLDDPGEARARRGRRPLSTS